MNNHHDTKDRTDLTILLVEDEETLRTLLARQLSHFGYRVLEAGDGVHALEIFESNGNIIDLLITDIMMPRMDGIEMAKKMRESKPSMPILFISGYMNGTDLEQDFGGENIYSMRKPFTLRALTDQVEGIISV